MSTLAVVGISISVLLLAYRFYGDFLAKSIFRLDDQMLVPSKEFQDDVDFVPTKKSIVFGHHFTSIAGTGPIVGPAVAVFWGWLPALLWVLFGGVFIGAVHDFGALVLSLQNKGQTIGQIAGRVISKRARFLFLLILFFALSIVLGIFGLVIAVIFKIYPASVFPTWISLPLAIGMGFLLKKQPSLLVPAAIVCLTAIFGSIYAGNAGVQVQITEGGLASFFGMQAAPSWLNPITFWTVILLSYCFVASVVPVWILLQPRDFLNSWLLVIALVCLVSAIVATCLTGRADLVTSAPMITPPEMLPSGLPPMFPFLFITIACGAVSGFHCLVSSGTTSKQVACASDAKAIGYGGMLLESGLAVTVIVACCAGIGMGVGAKPSVPKNPQPVRVKPVVHKVLFVESSNSGTVSPADDSVKSEIGPVSEGDSGGDYSHWAKRYSAEKDFGTLNLGDKVSVFVDGGASFFTTFKVPFSLGQTFLAVLVACFAATTLDTATRLQRYVIQELSVTIGLKPFTNKYAATGLAVFVGGLIAFMPAPGVAPGKGGMLLWPVFGAINQLLASLAFLVIFVFLWRRKLPAWIAGIPLALMTLIPIWGMILNLNSPKFLRSDTPNYFLSAIAVATIVLQIWMIVEAILVLPKVKGVLEDAED